MIHLDTHVVVWLYAELDGRLPDRLRQRLEVETVAISPMVRLELAFLVEIGRFTDTPAQVLSELGRALDLRVDPTPLASVVEAAEPLTFTRDPFDRLIAAQALAAGADLATKDERIRAHVDVAVWD